MKMEKIERTSLDITKDNIEKIKELFPNVVTEGKIDFDALRTILGDEVDDNKEKYQFTWNGKSAAIKLALSPSNKTLVPVKKDSKYWDNTHNLYLEGDNLEILKQLQKTFYRKIDVIYIDPPYNTGRNLIYKNNYTISKKEYLIESGQSDEDGNVYVSNPKSSGKFHSDWLSMMYSRLMLAKNLLSSQGVIAIAMDESEIGNLYKLCQELFGESNVLGTIVTRCNPQGRGAINIDPTHEYHIICAKDIESLEPLQLKRNSDNKIEYQTLMRTGTNSRKEERPLRYYPILIKDNHLYMITPDEYNHIYANKGTFDEEFLKELTQKYSELGYEVIFPTAKNGEQKVWQREFRRVLKEHKTYVYENGTIKVPKSKGKTPFSLWNNEWNNNVEYGTNLLKKLFNGKKVFDYAKSLYTVKDIISLCSNENAYVLDFFSGSATTAHAVMELNAQDGGDRKFIMVQLQELCEKKSEAYKAGYENICEIGKERIRRAGEQIKSEWLREHLENSLFAEDEKFSVDIGFKVFKLDSSNIMPWDPSMKLNEYSLLNKVEVFKKGRSNEDILYEIMLKYGIFDMQAKEVDINGKLMYRIGKRYMLVCLANNINSDDIKAIAEQSPKVVVFKDSGFKSDNDKINAEHNLKKAGVEDVKCI